MRPSAASRAPGGASLPPAAWPPSQPDMGGSRLCGPAIVATKLLMATRLEEGWQLLQDSVKLLGAALVAAHDQQIRVPSNGHKGDADRCSHSCCCCCYKQGAEALPKVLTSAPCSTHSLRLACPVTQLHTLLTSRGQSKYACRSCHEVGLAAAHACHHYKLLTAPEWCT